MRILITGANGQLGSEFRAIHENYPQHEFHFMGSKELDITQPNSVLEAFEQIKPEVVINCAAYTAVDQAEDEPEKAFAVNAEGVKNLVEACGKCNTALIHISTDYVFDGTKETPYLESDPTKPINVYGESKLKGEQYVLNSTIKGLVIRTSWVYSSFGANFVKTMIRLGKEREELNVVSDQFGSPTYARDLAEACLTLIDQLDDWPEQPSVYHYSNEGVISWHEFAKEIMKQAGLKCKANPIPTEAYPMKAKRPKYSVLSTGKLQAQFAVGLKDWKSSLKESINKLLYLS